MAAVGVPGKVSLSWRMEITLPRDVALSAGARAVMPCMQLQAMHARVQYSGYGSSATTKASI